MMLRAAELLTGGFLAFFAGAGLLDGTPDASSLLSVASVAGLIASHAVLRYKVSDALNRVVRLEQFRMEAQHGSRAAPATRSGAKPDP